MLRHLRFALFAAFLAAAPQLFAQVQGAPQTIDYQGRVLDANNVPLGNTTPTNYEIKFRIWDRQEGGNLIWAERQVVTVDKGNFSVRLGEGAPIRPNGGPSEGSISALPDAFKSRDRFLGLTVVIPGQPEGEIGPRLAFLSTPYAYTAEKAASVDAAPGTNSSFVRASFSDTATFNGAATFGGTTTLNGAINLSNQMTISNRNVLEFGVGEAKEPGSGKIGYNIEAPGLNIYGGADQWFNRKLTIFAEGGTEFRGPISFGNRVAQHINLWGTGYGIGIMGGTMYHRVENGQNFRWFDGGTGFNADPSNAANGRTLAILNGGGFTLNTGRFVGDGSGLTNVPIPSTVNNLTLNGSIQKPGHGPFIASFGDGHVFGSQDFTTYSRTARSFAWYLNGTHNDGELNPGGGTELMRLSTGGLSLPNSPVSFGSRLGQHINLAGTTSGLGVQDSGGMYLRAPIGGSMNFYFGGAHNAVNGEAGGGVATAQWKNDRFDFLRRVYVGPTSSDGQAPLFVNGSSSSATYGRVEANRIPAARFYRIPDNGTGYDNNNFSASVSIRASDAVLAKEFIALSDLRLKNPEGRSDSAQDLKLLSSIAVTNYTMKDDILHGSRRFKKVIAQQVESVYPQAVTRTNGVIPDIFRSASARDGVIQLKEPSISQPLKKGEIVRLLQGTTDVSTKVIAVTPTGFSVETPIEDGALFVYGRQVEDLRVVDYEAISMLNVSATQQIKKEKDAEIKALQEENAELRTRLSALEAKDKAREARLSAIEKSLRPSVQAAALKLDRQ